MTLSRRRPASKEAGPDRPPVVSQARLSLLGGALGALLVFASCAPHADDPPSGQAAATHATPLPCDVAKVLSDRCWSCHGAELQYTAPMHLSSWDAVHAPSKSDASKPTYVRIGERIHDTSNPMPPSTWPARPSAAELAVLDRWVAAGAPPGNESAAACQPQVALESGGSSSGAGGASSGGASIGGGDGGATGTEPGRLPTGDGGSVAPERGGVDAPVAPDSSECTTLSLHARQDATGAPFPVPTGEGYYCFSFHVPLSSKTHGLAFYKHIDNKQVIHHWLLYKMITPQFDGLALGCIGFHIDGALLAGWAPGGGDWILPKDVGMDLGGGDFLLEVHYSNTGPATTDTSGVDICSTSQLRPVSAGLFWLGTMDIDIPAAGTGTAQSHCTPQIQEPLHILRSWPHMHRLGRHLTTTVVRAGSGATEPVIDVPFDFNYQNQYDTPFVVNPGDRLDTTCTYDNRTGASSVGFGESTSSEMCFDFTVAYPDTANLPGGTTPTGCNN
jgi:hypothetical protein